MININPTFPAIVQQWKRDVVEMRAILRDAAIGVRDNGRFECVLCGSDLASQDHEWHAHGCLVVARSHLGAEAEYRALINRVAAARQGGAD